MRALCVNPGADTSRQRSLSIGRDAIMPSEFVVSLVHASAELATGPVVSVAAYGNIIAEAAYSGTVVLRDVDTRAVLDIARTSHLATAVVFSPDGHALAVGTADNHGLVFDIRAGDQIVPRTMVPTTDDVEAAAFSADGRYVLFG